MDSVAIYAQLLFELLKLVERIREKAKREGITDEELERAIQRFDPDRYRDPLGIENDT